MPGGGQYSSIARPDKRVVVYLVGPLFRQSFSVPFVNIICSFSLPHSFRTPTAVDFSAYLDFSAHSRHRLMFSHTYSWTCWTFLREKSSSPAKVSGCWTAGLTWTFFNKSSSPGRLLLGIERIQRRLLHLINHNRFGPFHRCQRLFPQRGISGQVARESRPLSGVLDGRSGTQ